VIITAIGYLGMQETAKMDYLELEKIILANYLGLISILNLITKKIILKNGAVVIGISSVAGDVGRKNNFIYGSAKSGFNTYLSGLGKYLKKKKIHVLTVKPGYVKTKMTAHLEMPPLLTVKPKRIAKDIYKAYTKRKKIIYTPWFWKYIMLLVKIFN